MGLAFIEADESVALRDWTVGDLLGHAVAAAPDRIALKLPSIGGQPALSWSYRQLREDSRRLAALLLDYFQPGEFIAIWAANSPQWILYQLAAAQAGLVLVVVNPALHQRETEPLLRRSGAVGLIVDPMHRSTDLLAAAHDMRGLLPGLRTILSADEWRTQVATAPATDPLPPVTPSDPALLLFTSGTTGQPKGVLLRHRGIVNAALTGSLGYGLAEGLAWLGVLPLFHVGGSVTCTLGCIARLGTHIAVPNFRPGLALQIIAQERIAWLPLVPAMLLGIIRHDAFAHADLSSLQVLLIGGTTISPAFTRLVCARFRADVQIIFGQTEAAGGMCKTARHDNKETIAATVGKPQPHTALRIADLITGETTGTGEAGEICIRSPFMADGYFNDPAASASAFDSLGFLRTGDIGVLDDRGYLRVTGRLKEVIIFGGENIYPREIEDAIAEYPGIAESAVVGVPSERWGQELAVAVRLRPGREIGIEAVQDFLRSRLARHKVPKLWKLVKEFPRTPSGKIRKFEVVAWFMQPSSQSSCTTLPHRLTRPRTQAIIRTNPAGDPLASHMLPVGQ